MALGDILYANGFDHQDSSIFDLRNGPPTFNTTPVHGRSSRSISGGSNADPYARSSIKGGGVSEFLACGAFYYSSQPNGNVVQLASPNSVLQMEVTMDGSGHFRITRNGTTLATGTTVFGISTWYWFTLYGLINATTGKYRLKINGNIEIALATGQNTKGDGASALVDRIYMCHGSGFLDDVYVIDATATADNGDSQDLGEVTIPWVVANGKGDTSQFTPKSTSVSRWYFPRPDLYPGDVNPTPHAEWDQTLDTASRAYKNGELTFDKSRATAISDSSNIFPWRWNVTSGQDILMWQYVSPPIAAQTISGTLKMYQRVFEFSAAYDVRSQLIIRVVSGDGQTVRGVLYAGDTGALASEWPITTAAARKVPPSTPITLSSVAASAGDRIVVEIGFRAHATNNDIDVRSYVGDNGASDLPENETDTNNYNPWCEFSTPITLDNNTNFAMVDDPAVPNDSIDYVEAVTNGNIELENLQTVSGAAAIKGIVEHVRMWRDTVGPKSARVILKSGGTQSSDSDVALSTSPVTYLRPLRKNPVTTADFTQSEIDALQAGAEVRS